MSDLCIHVGYPKTATTTFQIHVFSQHSQIDYLGKFHPAHDYRTAELGIAVNELISVDSTRFKGIACLHALVEGYRRTSDRPVVMISTESIIHPWAIDRGLVAERLKDALGDCRVLITIREQFDAIESFFDYHGRHGSYLILTVGDDEKVQFPLTFDEWLKFNLRNPDKNYVSTIQYYETISRYIDIFGRENVGVLLYEEFVQNPVSYITKLCDFVGIDGVDEAVRLAANRREVVGPRNQGRDEVVAGSKSTAGVGPGVSPPRESLWDQLCDPDYKVIMLDELYRQGNRQLQDSTGLPLNSFGYRV